MVSPKLPNLNVSAGEDMLVAGFLLEDHLRSIEADKHGIIQKV